MISFSKLHFFALPIPASIFHGAGTDHYAVFSKCSMIPSGSLYHIIPDIDGIVNGFFSVILWTFSRSPGKNLEFPAAFPRELGVIPVLVVIHGENYCPEAGDVYIVPPNSNHYYASDREEPWRKLWFNVDGTLLPDLLAAYGLTDSVLLKGCPFEERFDAGLRELRMAAAGDPDELSARIVVPLFAALGRFVRESRAAASPAAEVRRYLAALPPGEGLEPKKLLWKSGRSVSQTIRVFKKEFGTTPYASFLDRRIKAAKYLLRSTSRPVKEIALQLGWENPCYFARLFKRKTKMTPSEYRASSPPPMERSGYGAAEEEEAGRSSTRT